MRLPLLLCLLARLGSLQEMPVYRPRPLSPGVIRVLGNSHMDELMEIWEAGLREHKPGVRFENTYLGTANAIAGLYLKTADLALMGREVMPMEDIAYRRVFPNSPLQLAVPRPASMCHSKRSPSPSPSSSIGGIRFRS